MDLTWLSQEAKNIHQIFVNDFYLIVTTLLLVGVLLEYFKFPLGGSPAFGILVSRIFIAAMLLAALPEIMNAMTDLTDAISSQFGDMSKFKLVLGKMGEKFKNLSWSWVSVKDSVIIMISFVSFFVLYITIYLADAMFVYTWMLLFIFSPLLIALYILPATAGATKAMFRSMMMVCAWKCVWSVLASLLWSLALSDLNKPEHDISFLSAIILNIMLAYSILVTPKITNMFLVSGIHEAANSFGSTLGAAANMTPAGLTMMGKRLAMKGMKNTFDFGSEKGEQAVAAVKAHQTRRKALRDLNKKRM